MAKKHNNPFAACDGLEPNKTFSILSDKMALSKTYQELSHTAKYVLQVCKLCRQYHRKNDCMLDNNPLLFYFNRELQKRYGLKNANTTRKALCELIQGGFIDVRENNGHRRTKNVYSFSGKWQIKEKTGKIELSQAAKTFLQGHKKT